MHTSTTTSTSLPFYGIDQPQRPIQPLYFPSYVGGEFLVSYSWDRKKDYDTYSYEVKKAMTNIADELLRRVRWMNTSNYGMIGQYLSDLLNEYGLVETPWRDLNESARYELQHQGLQFLWLMGFTDYDDGTSP